MEYGSFQMFLTATETHMPYDITQLAATWQSLCASHLRLVLDLAALEGCKADLI